MGRRAGSLVLVGAVALLGACGGGDEPTVATTTSSTSSSSTTTTSTPSTTTSTTSATPTKALPPLSRFENDPRVKALRGFAVQYGRAVNAKNRNYKPWLATLSPRAVKERGQFIDGDLGQRYPGPIPFTPVKVTSTSSTSAEISLCVQWQGWGLDPKTNQPARKRSVGPAYAKMIKSGNTWVLDVLGADETFSCAKTKVVGRAW